MKKLFLFLLLVPTIYAQIDFINSFPKIGFGDWYCMRNDFTSSQIWRDNNYYYSKQIELGYNYLVSRVGSDLYPLNHASNIKILHSLIPPPINDPKSIFDYCWSGANDPHWLSYEVGSSNLKGDFCNLGSEDYDIDKSNFFGFGNPELGSWWTQYSFYEWAGHTFGDKHYHDINSNVYVFHVDKGTDTAGVMLRGSIDPYHTFVGNGVNGQRYTYTLELTAKIKDIDGVSPTDIIAEVTVWEDPDPNPKIPSESGLKIERTVLGESIAPVQAPRIFPLTLSDFSDCIDQYGGVKIKSIHKVNGSSSKLYFTVDWKKKCSLFIDKFSIYDQYYEELFLTSSPPTSDIVNLLNSIPGSGNSNFGHLYIDEPASMYYRSIGRISDISLSASGNKYCVNGALGSVDSWGSHLNKYERDSIPYVMSDIYPFMDTIPTTQLSLDYLVSRQSTNNAGTFQYGLRTMIDYAHGFTPNDLTDDRPFIQTIQVIEEDKYDDKNVEQPWYRAPTQNEILVQGWLALCYGAKGLAYYTTWSGGTTELRTWGLMIPDGYNEMPPRQWPLDNYKTSPFHGNTRFYEVKELNRQVDFVSSEILKLTWVNGYNIHKGELPTSNYISGISSYTTSGLPPRIFACEDLPLNTYVELGEFKKTADFQNQYLDYFLLVNRRCGTSDFRHIVANFNKTNSAYTNWIIKDIVSGRLWSINKIGHLDDTLSPGTGKLYRLTPVVLYGGDITNSETISGTNTLSGELSIKPGDTLTLSSNSTYNMNKNITIDSGSVFVINQGATLNIQNGASLVVRGTLVIGTNAILNIPGGDSLNVYGHIICESNIILNTGSTFKFHQGAILDMNSNDTLRIYGKLITGIESGTSTINGGLIIFSGSSSSNSILKSCTINNSSGIHCLNNANVTIENDSIKNSTNDGIYIYNSQPSIINNIIDDPQLNGIVGEAAGLSPWIKGNKITRTTDPYNYQGIMLGNSTFPDILNNEISYFCWGMYLWGGCQTNTFGSDFWTCNNRITYNWKGVGTAYDSYTTVGEDDGTGAFNSIFDNVYFNIYTYQYSYLTCFHNYLGVPTKLYADTTSNNDWDVGFIDDICSGSNINVKNNNFIANNLKKSQKDTFLEGLLLEKAGKIDDAIDFYKNLIINDDHANITLSRLLLLKNKYSKPDVTNYFESLLISNTKHYGKVKNLLGSIYLQNNRLDDAITAYNDVIKNSQTSYDGINARFEKLFVYLHIKNDPSTASQILSDIKGLNSKEEVVQMRIIIAENLIGSTNKVLKKNASTTEVNIPKTYELFQNYPNPFNPVTTIRYQIPKPGIVSLKVYDILGREVTTLVNENKIEGTYVFTFDASRFSSGVYVYQIKVNDYVSSRKMILLK